MTTSSEILTWHDLEAEEVYFVAHLEHQTRTQASQMLAKIAFSGDPQTILRKAQTLISRQEKRSEAWLNDQAILRGLAMASFKSMPKSRGYNLDPSPFNDWLDDLFNQFPTLRQTTLAKATGLTDGYISALRSGLNQRPNKETAIKIVKAFADICGIEDENKSTFINESVSAIQDMWAD